VVSASSCGNRESGSGPTSWSWPLSGLRCAGDVDVGAGQHTVELVDSHERRVATVARTQAASLLLQPKPERAARAPRTTAFIFSALAGSLSGCHGGSRESVLLLQRGAVVGRFRYRIREGSRLPPLLQPWHRHRRLAAGRDDRSPGGRRVNESGSHCPMDGGTRCPTMVLF
jgi:hypothetical protein